MPAHVNVHLTYDEIIEAGQIGLHRWLRWKRNGGPRGRSYTANDSDGEPFLSNMVLGACGELVWEKYSGFTWSRSIDERFRFAGDVGGDDQVFEIRARRLGRQSDLGVWEIEKESARPYILMHDYLPAGLKIIGWAYAREVIALGNYNETCRAYFATPDQLHDVEELCGDFRFFTVPATPEKA